MQTDMNATAPLKQIPVSPAVEEEQKRRCLSLLEGAREHAAAANADSHGTAERKDEERARFLTALRRLRATNRLLEETVQSYEGKILETIAENGQLFQRIDMLQDELFRSRTEVAHLTRTRQELRDRIEQLLQEREHQRRALSASEREIASLLSRSGVEEA